MHHTTLTRDYCCAKCYGVLVHRIVTPGEAPRTVCVNDPQHEGFVRKDTAFIRRQQAHLDALEVATTYGLRRNSAGGDLEEMFT